MRYTYVYSYVFTYKLSRTDLRGLVGFLTGHYPVRYHLNKMTLSDETICRLCLEEDETTEHILCECGALVRIRREVLSREVLHSGEIRNIPVRKIVTFIRKIAHLLT